MGSEMCIRDRTKDSLLVTIFSDDEGLPDEPVWSGLGNPGTTPEIIEIESNAVSDVLLIEGQNYWVTARSLNVTATYAWSFSLDGVGNAVVDPDGGEDFVLLSQLQQGAFRVNVDPTSIPEPAALLPLTVLSMICLRRHNCGCLLYTSPSPRDATLSRMPSSA